MFHSLTTVLAVCVVLWAAVTTSDEAVSVLAGVVGVLVGGAVAAAQTVTRDKTADVWGYPDVTITFD